MEASQHECSFRSAITRCVHAHALQRSHFVDDALEDAAHGFVRHGSSVVLPHVSQHLLLALGLVNRHLAFLLDASDLLDNARAFVQELDEPLVERIDPLPALGQRLGGSLAGHRSRAPACAISNPCFSSRAKLSSCTSSDGLSRLRSIRWTIALPTTTASTRRPNSATCSGREMPNPTASGNFVMARIERTSDSTEPESESRSPVTPVRET